jgi:hypothetical protein
MDVYKLFRWVILAALALFTLMVITLLLEPEYPEVIAAYLDGEGSGPLRDLTLSDVAIVRYGSLGILLAAMGAWLCALVGMFSFSPWSRKVYIAVVALGILLMPFMGDDFSFPASGTILTLLSMCDGALVALLLTAPIRERFSPGGDAR